MRLLVKNSGAQTVNGVTYAIFGLSNPPIYYYVQKIRPGDNFIWTEYPAISGHYDLDFKIDATNVVDESNENNNEYTLGVDVS